LAIVLFVLFQYNDQKKERTNNTMVKRRKEQTIQWPKEEKNKQYNGQKKKKTNNTMAKGRKEQTILFYIDGDLRTFILLFYVVLFLVLY
jgi:hypothetical protein